MALLTDDDAAPAADDAAGELVATVGGADAAFVQAAARTRLPVATIAPRSLDRGVGWCTRARFLV
jgi:hypothetical protein